MTDSLDTLRDYVRILHERDGVRHVHLNRTAREGLAKLAPKVAAAVPSGGAVGSRQTFGGPGSVRAAPASVGSRRPPGDGAVSGGPDNLLSGSPKATGGSGNRSQSLPVLSATSRSTSTQQPPIPTAPPLEISGSSKEEQLHHLAERAAACMKCPHLVARRHNVVFGVGNPDARLMFVGEGPGEDEDLKGEPFVGRAGQLLTKMIQAMGLTREQVYIGNVVKCRPDMPEGAPGNRKPTKQEMETCLPYLRAQIEVIKPTVMVALGATAVEGLLGPVGTIGSIRGKFLEYNSTPLMPTYHPAFLLRNPNDLGNKRKVWEDLLKVMERLEMPVTEKQRNFFLKA